MYYLLNCIELEVNNYFLSDPLNSLGWTLRLTHPVAEKNFLLF